MFHHVTLRLLAVTLAVVVVKATDPNDGDDQSSVHFVFDMPDLMATIATSDGGEAQLEAYKSVTNDQVMMFGADDDPTATAAQLLWVSVGHPAFVATPDSSSSSSSRLFHFTPSGFYAYIEMLTAEQRHLLAATASAKYGGVTVKDRQVSNLILSNFDCSLSIYDSADNRFVVNGRVTDFRTFPLRIDFEAPNDSVERDLIAKQLKETDDLQFSCQMASSSKVPRTATLTVGAQQLQEIGIVEKLFGLTSPEMIDATPETVCVTQRQLVELAEEMYSILNVADDYRMSSGQFVEAFVDEMAERVAEKNFEMQPLDLCVRGLSTYGMRLIDYPERDRLIDRLKSLLRIDERDGRRAIVVDETVVDEMEKQYGEDDTDHGTLTRRLGIETSIDWARNNSVFGFVAGKTIDEQLIDLNGVAGNDVKWSTDFDRVVPENIRAAVFGRSRFAEAVTFKKVHLETLISAFDTEFSLYTIRAVESPAASAVPSTDDQFQTQSTTTTETKVHQERQDSPTQISNGMPTSRTEKAMTNEVESTDESTRLGRDTTHIPSTTPRSRPVGD